MRRKEREGKNEEEGARMKAPETFETSFGKLSMFASKPEQPRLGNSIRFEIRIEQI